MYVQDYIWNKRYLFFDMDKKIDILLSEEEAFAFSLALCCLLRVGRDFVGLSLFEPSTTFEQASCHFSSSSSTVRIP